MATTPPSSLPPAIVLDASISVSVASKEAATEPRASAEINRYSEAGYTFSAPGVIIAEKVYVLCGRLQDGTLSAADHIQPINDFYTMMRSILPPPQGEPSLILRAEAIRGSY